MTNYLSYIGLGSIGYLFGFQFVLLCHSLYDSISNGSKLNYYKLFMTYLLYSTGILGSLYVLLLIFIYNFMSDHDNYTKKIVDEYDIFMKYYDDEIKKNSSKKSDIVEYWKKGIVIYDDCKVKWMERFKYYHNFYSWSYAVLCNSLYCDYINSKIDEFLKWLVFYLTLNRYYNKIKESIDEFIKQVYIQENKNNKKNDDLDNIDEFIAKLEELTKINTINTMSTIDIGKGLKKRKKKIPNKPPPGFNKK